MSCWWILNWHTNLSNVWLSYFFIHLVLAKFVKIVFHKFYLVHFWIPWPTLPWLCPNRHNDVITTLLRRCYPTSLWRRHIVAMETSDDIVKTTSLQRLIKRRRNETLQRRRFCNIIWRFHCNYMATSEQRRMVTS